MLAGRYREARAPGVLVQRRSTSQKGVAPRFVFEKFLCRKYLTLPSGRGCSTDWRPDKNWCRVWYLYVDGRRQKLPKPPPERRNVTGSQAEVIGREKASERVV